MQRTRLWPYLLALCALFAAPPLHADQGAADAPFRMFTVRDGLTQSQVSAVRQDQAGYLWFTTARGLNRYDGKDFDHYTIADGLPANTLTALHVGETDTIWVGDTRGNLTAIRAGRIVSTSRPESLEGLRILDIEIVGPRLLVVAEGAGLVVMAADGSEAEARVLGDATFGFQNVTIDGTDIWVESASGLYALVPGAEIPLDRRAENIRHIDIDQAGTLWAVDSGKNVGRFVDGEFRVILTVPTELEIVSIDTDKDGIFWLATSTELFRIDSTVPGAAAKLNVFGGIDEVASIFVDKENSLWLASGLGLARFLGERFSHYPLRVSTDPAAVWSIAEDHQGQLWFGTNTRLLLRESDESLLVVGPEAGIPEGAVRDIVVASDGDLWLGIRGFGLFRVDPYSRTGVHIEVSGDAEILDVAVAPDGAIWYSTFATGVFRYLPWSDQLQHFNTPDTTSVYSLDIWVDGTVWYGADDVGLVRLSPRPDGGYDSRTLHDVILKDRFFDHIRLTGPDSAWIATEEGGVIYYSNGTFASHVSTTQLADQTIYFVEPLPNGTVVVGGEQGIYQFMPSEPGLAHFNDQRGFVSLETNVHATLFDSSGHLWIGTIDGATRMDVTKSMPRQFLPTPSIVSVETELDRIQIPDGSEIDPTQLGARVEFAAISLLNPREIEYSYKLVGVDTEWGPPATHRSVSYPRVPPGEYEFMVRARYADGQWSGDYASHRFAVRPFFWQRHWFVLLAALAVLLCLRAVMVYRTRNIERANNALRAQVEDRTRSIELARQNLEFSNAKLSKEIEARSELEARFRRAFENAPIGMGLLDHAGVLFDANPSLKNMFWPDADVTPEVSFFDKVSSDELLEFQSEFHRLVSGEQDSLDQKVTCNGAHGEELQTVVNISTVRSDQGEFLYAVVQIQDVTESLKLTVQLEYQASYDELTGLLNRRAFEARLQEALQASSPDQLPSSLLYMDLDQFKVVNDTSGHSAGDQLLRAISEILLDSVRTNDIVARLGGDEFAVILWHCPTEVATRIAESVRSAIEVFRFQWDNEVYRIGVSIGIVPIDRNIGDIGELQQLADAACYAAKEAGRNRVHMVTGEKDSARDRRGQVRWVQRLREAMDNNRFAIYAQVIKPLHDNTGEPEHQEILLRLRDPESRRLIPPGAFLPAAERYGLSIELDKWVVASLLNALFIHRSFHAEERCYWINLSGASIGDQRFAAFLTDAIRKSPLPPGTINFEITETAVIRSITEAGILMTSLREMGCKFALDDFGSGLSSFGYLKKLPVDHLKIDGMFIRGLLRDRTDRIFVKSIIDIAHTLNIKTTAEFIENEQLLDVVRELGADYAQGFAIGRPFVLAPQFPVVESANAEILTFETKAS